eukprot:TRINITY_DN3316_c0_g1_i2.p1 TRINITY_DN3316_c0_g1~~TRINITY_DN3316_c0_g1_i2.p1  ORF type:complete len:441 (-),score=88.06 TRINITY_DN3316_c0_g1_i2:1136-2305(-)
MNDLTNHKDEVANQILSREKVTSTENEVLNQISKEEKKESSTQISKEDENEASSQISQNEASTQISQNEASTQISQNEASTQISHQTQISPLTEPSVDFPDFNWCYDDDDDLDGKDAGEVDLSAPTLRAVLQRYPQITRIVLLNRYKIEARCMVNQLLFYDKENVQLRLAKDGLEFRHGGRDLVKAISAAKNITSLELRNISRRSLNMDISRIIQLNSSLTKLTLFSWQGENIEKALMSNTTLKEIVIRGDGFDGGGIGNALLVNTTLKSITFKNLTRNDWNAYNVIIPALRINHSLTNLNLYGYKMNPTECGLLSSAIETHPALTSLNLCSTGLLPDMIKVLLSSLETNSTLTSLNISKNKIKDTTQELAFFLIKNTKLIELFICCLF